MGVPIVAQWVKNLASLHDGVGSIPGLAQWAKDLALPWAVCGVGHGHGSDLALLWLWCRLAAAAPIPPLAWEPPYAIGLALKKKKSRRRCPHTPSPWQSAEVRVKAEPTDKRRGSITECSLDGPSTRSWSLESSHFTDV